MGREGGVLHTGDVPVCRVSAETDPLATTAEGIRYKYTRWHALSETLEADGPYFYKLRFQNYDSRNLPKYKVSLSLNLTV